MKEYDVVIIGGGIHGAGVLQAAAAAGHSALLIERQALAAGTSSRSSKLIHGGLRYLESGQFALVRESLRERAIHLRIASELVALKPFYIPVYRDTRRRPWQLKIGLWIYALLGGFGAATRFGTVPESEWPQLDGLKTLDLDAVVRYHDAQTDDALLTRAVVKSALGLGAELAMPARYSGAILHEDAVTVNYSAAGAALACRARVLVNAAGPWAMQAARAVEPAIPIPDVDLVQGTHIVIPHPLTAGIYYVESPADGRAVFVMPWGGATLVGTTETPYRGDPDDVQPLPAEEEYLLAVVRHYFPALGGFDPRGHQRAISPACGCCPRRRRRPSTARARPYSPRIETYARACSCIYGGKLTGWRAAAAHVLQRISPSLPAADRRAETDLLILRRPT